MPGLLQREVSERRSPGEIVAGLKSSHWRLEWLEDMMWYLQKVQKSSVIVLYSYSYSTFQRVWRCFVGLWCSVYPLRHCLSLPADLIWRILNSWGTRIQHSHYIGIFTSRELSVGLRMDNLIICEYLWELTLPTIDTACNDPYFSATLLLGPCPCHFCHPPFSSKGHPPIQTLILVD